MTKSVTLDAPADTLGSALALAAVRRLCRRRADARHRPRHSGRAVPVDFQRGQRIVAGLARPPRHTLQYVVKREQSIILTKVVLLIALLAVARKFIVFDLRDVDAVQLLARAAITLALGLAYWLMRERDDRLGDAALRRAE